MAVWRKTIPDGTMIDIALAFVYYVAEDEPGVWRIHLQGTGGVWTMPGDFETQLEAQTQMEADCATLSA